MKNQIVIVEDNFDKYFATKQVVESILRLRVKVKGVDEETDLFDELTKIRPGLVIQRPAGGVMEIVNKLQKKKVNRINTEVTLIVTHDLGNQAFEKIADYKAFRAQRKKSALKVA